MTDIINVTPTENEIQLGSKTDAMLQAAAALEITDSATAETATDMAKQLASAIKKLDDERLAITKPFRDGVDAINARFGGLKERLQKANSIVRGKLLEHQELQEALAKEEREKQAAITAAAEQAARELAAQEAAERAATTPESPASAPLPEIAPVIITKAPKAAPVSRVRSDSGAVASVKKVWRARIVDVAALAAAHPEMVAANMGMVNARMQEAITKDRSKVELELPGVEFYQENQLGVR